VKICIVSEYFPGSSKCDIRGGAEVVAFYEAKHLAINHDVDVLCSYELLTNMRDKFCNINVIRCGRQRSYVQKNAFFKRLSFLYSAFTYAKKQKYDIVLGYSIITYPIAWKISKKLNIPVAIRYHDVLLGKWIKNFGLMAFVGALLERYTLSLKFDAIIAVSNYTAHNLKKHFKFTNRIFVVHNSIDVPELNVNKADRPTIVCVSRLVKYKNIEDLIHAVCTNIKHFPDLHCIIIGTGPEENRLKNLVHSLGIDSHITFKGFVKEHINVLETIKSAQVFCLPSTLEGFGIVIIEAMACGIPFVASDIPPLIEVSNYKGGLFFKSRDVEDLSEKLKLILEDNELRNRLSSEGLERANEFRWSVVAKKIENICQEITKLN